jgi:hypothetical protein
MPSSKYGAICRLGIMIFCGLFLSGCNSGGDAEDVPADISGAWSGTMSIQGNLFAVALVLTQSGENITGTFSMNYGGSTDSGTVEGIYSDGAADFTLKYGNYSIAAATLTFRGNRATGQVLVLVTDETGNLNLFKE